MPHDFDDDDSFATDEGAGRVTSHKSADEILDDVERLARFAEQSQKPLEVDPFRSQLFELFAAADAAGFVDDDSPVDLTADGICGVLAERWGLRAATEQSLTGKNPLPPGQMAAMRSLWSVMRLWMEWTYAWSRWREFHAED